MKYVRTNNGVYDTKDYEVTKIISIYEPSLFEGINEGDLVLNVNCAYKKVIKQADTIEELCDGFIFKDTYANDLHLLDKKDGISILGASLFKDTLRGFIETDKGLIYVAKMNEKGELELI